MPTLIESAFVAERVVLSVVGPHAGEGEADIFARKRRDIEAIGRTFWLCCSPAARPDRTQPFEPAVVLFLAPSSASGARPTTEGQRADFFSVDGATWTLTPSGMGPVTGNLSGKPYAFVLDALEHAEHRWVDLWQYALPNGEPVRFRLGASTALAERVDTSTHPQRMKAHVRRVVAVGRLVEPIAVWMK